MRSLKKPSLLQHETSCTVHIRFQHTLEKKNMRTNIPVFFPVGWNCHTLVLGRVSSSFLLDPDPLRKPWIIHPAQVYRIVGT